VIIKSIFIVVDLNCRKEVFAVAVIMYTKNGCPYCKAAKEDFSKRKIEFDEINVSEKPDRIQEMVKIAGIRKVPVIVDNGKVTVGFNGGG
jgi:glutaredoxin